MLIGTSTFLSFANTSISVIQQMINHQWFGWIQFIFIKSGNFWKYLGADISTNILLVIQLQILVFVNQKNLIMTIQTVMITKFRKKSKEKLNYYLKGKRWWVTILYGHLSCLLRKTDNIDTCFNAATKQMDVMMAVCYCWITNNI